MTHIISWLLDTSMGSPGPSGQWPLWLAILFHASNLVIGVADLAILFLVIRGWKYKRDGVPTWRIVSAVAFLPAMAFSRFARVLSIAGFPCNLATILDVLTAILSVYSAIQFRPLIKHILKLPSLKLIHDTLDELQREVWQKDLMRLEAVERAREAAEMNGALVAKIAAAQARIDRLEHDKMSADWWRAQKTALTEIQDQFQAIAGKNEESRRSCGNS